MPENKNSLISSIFRATLQLEAAALCYLISQAIFFSSFLGFAPKKLSKEEFNISLLKLQVIYRILKKKSMHLHWTLNVTTFLFIWAFFDSPVELGKFTWAVFSTFVFQHNGVCVCLCVCVCVCVSFKQLVLKYFPFVDKQDRVSTVHDFSDLCILLFLMLQALSLISCLDFMQANICEPPYNYSSPKLSSQKALFPDFRSPAC